MSERVPMGELVHEMRNELAIARANLEGLVDGKFAPTKERLLAIIQALGQLEALVEDMRVRDVAVDMPARPSLLDVCALLDREYRSIEPIARARGVSVSIHQCPVPLGECVHFYGDAARIGQIVKNVLINAVRYTPRGGTISVDCTHDADQLEIRVADTGPGLADGESAQIFEPGFRGEASRGTAGSGYGLSVAKHLVEEQGGTIEAAAASPHGAVFTVRLPGRAGAMNHLCSECRLPHAHR
ncbi:MAG: HAMP domain-containing histidine kinase [Candidatus Eremiobacteraeota bacterium]|nr:HAMP domain-containing histidine kinase [Candidatus Eremiobacteraeota bacterium]